MTSKTARGNTQSGEKLLLLRYCRSEENDDEGSILKGSYII